MAVTKLVNLLAISTLAILASSLNAVPGANALTVHGSSHHDIHHRSGAQRINARNQTPARKRDLSKRCKPRTSSAPAATTSHAAATSAAAPPPPAKPKTSSAAQKPPQTTEAHKADAAAAKPSSPAKAVAATTPPPSKAAGGSNPMFPGCNGKRGLAWSNHESHLIPQFVSNQMCFIYDWEESLQYGMTIPKGMYFIPQLWGYKNEGDFASKVVKGYAQYAAGMNEPDIGSQSNMSPQDGANLWNKHFCGLKSQGYTLLSPATATGVKWLQDFKNAGACDWDITTGHIYTTSVDDFKKVATSYATAFNKPVAITEWACQSYNGGAQCSSGQIQDFMSGVMSFMDNDDRFVAYAMFAPMTSSELSANNLNGANAMISSGGNSLTSLGSFYVYADL